MAVETFFMLSGLLTAYVPLMDFNKGRKFNIVKYYVYRYVRQVKGNSIFLCKVKFFNRITVPYAVVIWYASTLNVLVSHGPMWYFTIGLTTQNCKENWWASFLYVTNYFFEGVSSISFIVAYFVLRYLQMYLAYLCNLRILQVAAVAYLLVSS